MKEKIVCKTVDIFHCKEGSQISILIYRLCDSFESLDQYIFVKRDLGQSVYVLTICNAVYFTLSIHFYEISLMPFMTFFS